MAPQSKTHHNEILNNATHKHQQNTANNNRSDLYRLGHNGTWSKDDAQMRF
jgi:hypothetical protein